jgi:hypothetical protein
MLPPRCWSARGAFRKKLGKRYDELRRGKLTASDLAQSVASMVAHLERGQSRALRRKEMQVVEI